MVTIWFRDFIIIKYNGHIIDQVEKAALMTRAISEISVPNTSPFEKHGKIVFHKVKLVSHINCNFSSDIC